MMGFQAKAFTVRLMLSALITALAAVAGAAFPGEVSLKANKAKEAYEAGNFEEAARLYEEAIKIDPNDPRLKFNLGLSNFKEGKPDKALEQLTGVYDENNLGLVTRSRAGAGLVEQHQAREALEGLQNSQTQGAENAKDATEKTISLLKSSLEKYREALTMGQTVLSEQNLNDTSYNYEVARRQLEDLLKKQEEEKKQQQQDQKDDQQKDDQQQQQDQKDQQQNKEDQQNQDQEQKDQQQQDQQNQQKKDEQKGKDGDQQKDEQQDQKDQKDEQPEGQPTPTPGPTPQATPPPNATPPPDKGDDATAGNPDTQSPEQPPEMSKEDVERLLNGLPDNDREALQRFYGNQKPTNERMEKDW
ncbi:hypothetical protein CVU37_01455 [candidate division BRC1 bacterium HGW-BRC1-1]|jgi:Ca-activated chloride channel family protein|nr:MAG: hypothetical protein CVU37_01455 [candidate division BRC1 bacterium HGW-BRC1-1]